MNIYCTRISLMTLISLLTHAQIHVNKQTPLYELLSESHLSECAELHDDPDWILSDDSHQLNNVGVVKLTHGHCRERRGGQRSVGKKAILPILESM